MAERAQHEQTQAAAVEADAARPLDFDEEQINRVLGPRQLEALARKRARNGAPLGPFWATFFTNASITDLWGSVLKCTLFGAIIAIVCCYKGMTASGGGEGVGRAVNQAVVISFMGVFAFNYAFTQTLLATNPDLQTIR